MELLETLAGAERAGRPFVAVVSPSIRELLPNAWPKINALLKSEGALSVHAVDAGIGEFARRTAREAARLGGGLRVLSACPMAARFLSERYPEYEEAVLDVPSPMAIQAETALAAAGIRERGWVFALTPCAYKRIEAARAPFDFHVVELRDFLSALSDCGRSLDDNPDVPYDRPPAAGDSHCAIAETVAASADGIGHPALPVKLNGVNEARSFFDRLRNGSAAKDADGRTVLVELCFCEGGCAGGVESSMGHSQEP